MANLIKFKTKTKGPTMVQLLEAEVLGLRQTISQYENVDLERKELIDQLNTTRSQLRAFRYIFSRNIFRRILFALTYKTR